MARITARIFLTILAALLVTPVGLATTVLEGEAGTARAFVADQEVTDSSGRSTMADLIRLEVQDDPDDEDQLLFTLTHGERPEAGIALVEDQTYAIHFRNGEVQYMVLVQLGYPLAEPGGTLRAYLYQIQEEEADYVGPLSLAEESLGHVTVAVQREQLLDANGLAPQKGRPLEAFAVESYTRSLLEFSIDGTRFEATPVDYRDRMPGDGVGTVPFESDWGLVQDGDLILQSATPLRWSNGEATAFAFDVVVRNLGTQAHSVHLAATGLPVGWAVEEAAPLTVEAGKDAAAVVLVHVPGAHRHGDTATFVLEGHSLTDPASVGRVELGVHYPAIPQPTGHHPTLWMHSRTAYENLLQETLFGATGRPDNVRGFMNADPQDPLAEGLPLPGWSYLGNEDGIDGTTYGWRLPLSPALRVGLDFDLAGVGDAVFSFRSDLDVPDARITGRFIVTEGADANPVFPGSETAGIIVATLDGEAPVAMGTSGALAATVTPTRDGDRVPFKATQQLYLDLYLLTSRPDNVLGPNIGVDLMGGEARLPLNEYHDTMEVPITRQAQEVLDHLDHAVEESTPQSRTTPGVSLVVVLLSLALVAGRRRTR